MSASFSKTTPNENKRIRAPTSTHRYLVVFIDRAGIQEPSPAQGPSTHLQVRSSLPCRYRQVSSKVGLMRVQVQAAFVKHGTTTMTLLYRGLDSDGMANMILHWETFVNGLALHDLGD